jgi:hypothetical protein
MFKVGFRIRFDSTAEAFAPGKLNRDMLTDGLVFLYAVLFVQAIHQPDIDENEDDKYINGSLVGKPEAEFGAPDGEPVCPVDGENAQYKGGNKPNREEDQYISYVLLPVSRSFFLIHNYGFGRKIGCSRLQEYMSLEADLLKADGLAIRPQR